MSTRSATARARAPPEPPSPITVAMTGTLRRAILSMVSAMARAWPPSSAATPGYAPGVSTNDSTGRPCLSARANSRCALRWPSGLAMPQLCSSCSSSVLPFWWPTTSTARPRTRDYIGYLIEGFEELKGDRLRADDPAIVGGLGWVRGRAVLVVGHQKGKTLDEQELHSWGMAKPEGYRKAQRLFALAERHGLPVLSFVDTP